MYLLEDTFSYNLRTISITLQPRDTESVIFSIINNRLANIMKIFVL